MSAVLSHSQEHRGEAFRTSTETCSTPKRSRLRDGYENVWDLVFVNDDDVLEGVDYIRVAADLTRLVLPSVTPHKRYTWATMATGLPDGVLERVEYRQTYQPKSIKTEYMVKLLRFATANGKDVFTVRGVREIHDHIFGGIQ